MVPVCHAVPCPKGTREFAAHLNLTCDCTFANDHLVIAMQTASLIGYARCDAFSLLAELSLLTFVCARRRFDKSS